jgi:hypothetical protein
MGERRYRSTILDLSTSWRRVVSFTPQLLYPQRKSPQCPLDRRLGGLQSQSGSCRKEKNLTPAGNQTPAFQPIAPHCTDWVIPTPCIIEFLSTPRFVFPPPLLVTCSWLRLVSSQFWNYQKLILFFNFYVIWFLEHRFFYIRLVLFIFVFLQLPDSGQYQRQLWKIQLYLSITLYLVKFVQYVCLHSIEVILFIARFWISQVYYTSHIH